MSFVEPIVCLFAIRYLNMYVYSLFANIILLDTIYSPGVENVSDHGTNGPRIFARGCQKIFRSKKELLARHKDKFLIGRKYIELENDKN